MASFLDYLLHDGERVDPAVKRELRRSLEDNDPSLDRLAISTFKYDDFDDFTYVPNNDEWQKDGIALGRHTHVKKMMFRLPDDLEEEKLRAFCAGMATNKSIESLRVSWGSNGSDLIRMLTPFFSQSGNLCSLRFEGWAHNTHQPAGSCNPARCVAEALGTFSTLTELSIGESKFNESGVEEVLRALAGHSRLESLNLYKNEVIGEGMAALVALLKQPTCAISELKLNDCSLDDASMATFANGIAGNSLMRSLRLSSNGEISDVGWGHFAGGLAGNDTLRVLDLSSNVKSYGRVAGVTALGWGSVFAQMQSLEELDLIYGCLDDASARALGLALAKETNKLKVLKLANNRTITPVGWRAIFGALPWCKSLECLDLSAQWGNGWGNGRVHDGFNDEEIACLVACLGNCLSLKTLDLRMTNRLTQQGWQVLFSLLRNPQTELATLDVAHNKSMDNEALAHFASAVRDNSKLEKIQLEWSEDDLAAPITDWSPLATALCDRTSIDATFTSNHTLQWLTTNSRWNPGISLEWRLNLPLDLRKSLRLNRDHGPAEVARRKILDVHFGGEFSMDPFLEMDMKALPRLVSWMARDDHGRTLLLQYVQRNASLFERTPPRLDVRSAKRMKLSV